MNDNDYKKYEADKKYKLDNGLTVILKKTPTDTVATGLNIKKGCIWEKEEQEGLNHLLENGDAILVTGIV